MKTEVTITASHLKDLIESALRSYRTQIINHINEKPSLCPTGSGGGICYTTFYWPTVRSAIEIPDLEIDLVNNKCTVKIGPVKTPDQESSEIKQMRKKLQS